MTSTSTSTISPNFAIRQSREVTLYVAFGVAYRSLEDLAASYIISEYSGANNVVVDVVDNTMFFDENGNVEQISFKTIELELPYQVALDLENN